jgi:hypothetical protein
MIGGMKSMHRLIVAVALFGGLLAAGPGVSLTASAASAASASPASPDSPVPVTLQSAAEVRPEIGPRLTFERTDHNWGKIWDIKEQVTTFKFTNTGDTTLVVDQIKPSCGCTTTKLDKLTYEPGEGNEIEVHFKAKGVGRQTKRISVQSNDPRQPVVQLSISADITPFVRIEPHAIRFADARLGQTKRALLQFTAADAEAIVQQVRQVGQLGPYLDVRFLPLDPSVVATGSTLPITRTLEVTLRDDAPWGPSYGAVDITVVGKTDPDSPTITHTAKVTVSAVVKGEIAASDNLFRIGLVEPGADFSFTVHLEREGGKEFSILSTELERVPFRIDTTVTPVKSESGRPGYDVTLSGNAGDYLGSISSYINIMTDVQGEERLPFRIAGIVRTLDASESSARAAGGSKRERTGAARPAGPTRPTRPTGPTRPARPTRPTGSGR